MDILTLEFLTALLIIIGIDLMLAGDNAIVIALAARKLPAKQQKLVIFWGTFGAIAIRVVATFALVSLLKLPFLHLIGGLLLIWISYKLIVDDNDHSNVQAGTTLGQAIRTIIVADAVMGLDNVLAIAGAAGTAEHSYLLVIIGLLISVPVIIYGSTLFIKLIGKFPWILYAGAGVLAYTAAKMITHEKWLIQPYFENHPVLKWIFMIVVIAGVIVAGKVTNDRRSQKSEDG